MSIAQDPSLARPALASTRPAEAEAAVRVLGIYQTFNLSHHDGELAPDLTLWAQTARLYRIQESVRARPFSVLCR